LPTPASCAGTFANLSGSAARPMVRASGDSPRKGRTPSGTLDGTGGAAFPPR
jgi:hypothetical protein